MGCFSLRDQVWIRTYNGDLSIGYRGPGDSRPAAAGQGGGTALALLPQIQSGELPSMHIVTYMTGLTKRVTKIVETYLEWDHYC